MRPMTQEVPDIGAATLARGADDGGRRVKQVEPLVPDLGETIRRTHARSDTRMDEAEEEQAGEARRRGAGHRLKHAAADVVRDDADAVHPQSREQCVHVGGVLGIAPRGARLVAVAEAAQVRRDQRVACFEPAHHRLPGKPEFRPAVEEEKRRPAAVARDMESGAVGLDGQMVHRSGLARRTRRKIIGIRSNIHVSLRFELPDRNRPAAAGVPSAVPRQRGAI